MTLRCSSVSRRPIVTGMIIAWSLIIGHSSATAVLGIPRDLCFEASPLGLQQAQEIRNRPGQSHEVLWLDVASPGILRMEIFPPSTGPAAPSIELLGRSCSASSSEELTAVERSSDRYLVKVDEPGIYFVGLRTPPEMPQGSYSLRSSFSRGRALTRIGGDHLERQPEKEEEHKGCDDHGDDGTWTHLPCPPTVPNLTFEPSAPQAILTARGEDVAIAVRQPGVLEIMSAGILLEVGRGRYNLGLGFSSLEDLVTGLPEAFRFYPLCGLIGADDHGDSFTCATEIAPGTRTPGEIRGLAATDQDVFTFTLSRRRAVIFETSGETDTRGRLFTETGFLLAADDDGGEAMNLRIVRTLGPGRYYLSVAGAGASQGPYLITATFTNDSDGQGVQP